MKYHFVLFFVLLSLSSCQQPSQQPVIGIYTQDAQDFIELLNQDLKQSLTTYIAASYVKNIQMGGAQVVPIFYHYSESQLQDILSKVNGVFFPGGGAMNITTDVKWTNNARFIMQYAKKQNKLGNNYPVWGTCLGYYLVMYVLSGETDLMKLLTRVTGQGGVVHPLILKSKDSKLLKSFSKQQLDDATQGQGIFYFYHNWSIMLSTLANYPILNDIFNVIATSKTSYGAQFLSILEGKQYPFFLTQFHAQKNNFQWKTFTKRTYNAISGSQKLVNRFIDEARKNKNIYPADQLHKKLIYNYQPIMIPLVPGTYFTQVYVFDESKISESRQESRQMIEN